MTDLVRTRIGPFSITDSYTLESIDSEAAVARAVQSPLVALGHLPIISPGEQELQRLKDGQRVRLAKPVAFAEQTHVAINANGQLHSIVKFDPSDGTWRVEKYFPG
jgi:tRNA U55 pseudouridine synthase TruB